jgi:hypothetical protein
LADAEKVMGTAPTQKLHVFDELTFGNSTSISMETTPLEKV